MGTTELSSQWRKSLTEFLTTTGRVTKKIVLLEVEGDQKEAAALIEPGISMKGVRLWFLIASCLIASIGLNTNSSAVIIGAMLISPLMGPIIGLGFGMAVTSQRTIRNSINNLFFAVFISLLISTLYFVISPFQDPTAEILARTAPNLLDLMVAIAAAFAGVVAMNSTSLAGAVPGVAIATAIMPPLCATSYGLAHGNWKIAFGAFYLFFVNAVAIAVVSFLLFKRMHFSEEQESNESGKFKPAAISFSIVLVVSPLIWSLWGAWQDNFMHRSVARLVQNYVGKLEIVSWQWEGAKSKKLTLYNFRKATPEIRTELEEALRKISPKANLELHETSLSPEMEELATQIKTTQLSALVKNPKIIEGLVRLASDEGRAIDLMGKLLSAEQELASLVGSQNQVKAFLRTDKEESEALILISPKTQMEKNQIRKMVPKYLEWLNEKTNGEISIRIELL